jgi:hypothetical protein
VSPGAREARLEGNSWKSVRAMKHSGKQGDARRNVINKSLMAYP